MCSGCCSPALAWLAIEVVFRGLTVDTASARFLAPWYIGMPFGMLVAVQALGGRMATLLLIATVVVSDTAQYYSGRTFGRRPLAPDDQSEEDDRRRSGRAHCCQRYS